MKGKIIFLNGASSSGKSTLARGLRDRLDLPFWHFSIDHLNTADVLPEARIRSGEFAWSALRESFFDGFHRCLPALADAGNNLVVEHIVETAPWRDRLIALLAPFDVYCVGVHCPLPELERRERDRGDRRIGEARADLETTHALCSYDFEVDSTCAQDRNVEAVITAWRMRQRPSAFERMAQTAIMAPESLPDAAP